MGIFNSNEFWKLMEHRFNHGNHAQREHTVRMTAHQAEMEGMNWEQNDLNGYMREGEVERERERIKR